MLICALSGASIQDASARAFCALRDPIHSIRELFPESSGHMSSVKAITEAAREEIGRQLPFTLHFNELGKHTLYIVQANGVPSGFVHVRSELGPWGLMEIAWALNPDLSVRNFAFQRCRAPACNETLKNKIIEVVTGASGNSIRSYITSKGDALSETVAGNFENDTDLVLAVFRSALKTIAVTGITWKDEVAAVATKRLTSEHWHPADPIRVVPTDIKKNAFEALHRLNGGAVFDDAGKLQLSQVYYRDEPSGWIVTSPWRQGYSSGTAYWLFSETGHVRGVRSVPPWPNSEVRSAYEALRGRQLTDQESCGTAVEVEGFELFFIASFGAKTARK